MSIQPTFYAPYPWALLIKLAQWLSPWIAHFHYRMDLHIEDGCLDRLKSLSQQRALLLPNHPTFHDPIALFLLSARTNNFFYFLAAQEAFRPKVGRWLQRLGCYSIRRGLLDRPSIAQTLDLLSSPATKLVIFAEGGCSFQNDTVMPFRSGSIQMAFQAMNRLVKQGEPIPDLYVVPVSLKYHYIDDMTQVIDTTLSRLENALEISSPSIEKNNYDRLRVVSEKVLQNLEDLYYPQKSQSLQLSWDERIFRLKNYVLEQCEKVLEINPNLQLPIRERVYKIQDIISNRDVDSPNTVWNSETIEKATFRLLNFDAIRDGYVAENPSPERFLDTLTRLERDVFDIDQPPAKGRRKVLLHIAEPINLKDYFENYLESKSNTVEFLTQNIQEIVQTNINRLSATNAFKSKTPPY